MLKVKRWFEELIAIKAGPGGFKHFRKNLKPVLERHVSGFDKFGPEISLRIRTRNQVSFFSSIFVILDISKLSAKTKISKTVLNIWKFMLLLKNLKFQKFKTFWIFEIFVINLKI